MTKNRPSTKKFMCKFADIGIICTHFPNAYYFHHNHDQFTQLCTYKRDNLKIPCNGYK